MLINIIFLPLIAVFFYYVGTMRESIRIEREVKMLIADIESAVETIQAIHVMYDLGEFT